MHLVVERLNLLFDGYLPRDSMVGDRFRQFFGDAKPLIDYAFKVEKPGYIRAWWFDRYLDFAFNVRALGHRPKLGRFYPTTYLVSDTDFELAEYLSCLGWDVRLSILSIDRQEYVVLALFSAEGAIMDEDEDYSLLTLEAKEDAPPCWDYDWQPDERRELVGA